MAARHSYGHHRAIVLPVAAAGARQHRFCGRRGRLHRSLRWRRHLNRVAQRGGCGPMPARLSRRAIVAGAFHRGLSVRVLQAIRSIAGGRVAGARLALARRLCAKGGVRDVTLAWPATIHHSPHPPGRIAFAEPPGAAADSMLPQPEKIHAGGQSQEVLVRNTAPRDFAGITDLCRRIYPDTPPWNDEQLSSHLRLFPEGQFVATHGEAQVVVGMSASLIVDWEDYATLDSWEQFTANGMFTNHDPRHGRTLYGAEVIVDPGL